MKSIHSESVLREIISIVTGRDLGEYDAGRYKKAMDWNNDPRRGYLTIDSSEQALRYLSSGNYTISNFTGGKGISNKRSGGCQGYFADGLLEQMVKDELIDFDIKRGSFGGIRKAGFLVLSK